MYHGAADAHAGNDGDSAGTRSQARPVLWAKLQPRDRIHSRRQFLGCFNLMRAWLEAGKRHWCNNGQSLYALNASPFGAAAMYIARPSQAECVHSKASAKYLQYLPWKSVLDGRARKVKVETINCAFERRAPPALDSLLALADECIICLAWELCNRPTLITPQGVHSHACMYTMS